MPELSGPQVAHLIRSGDNMNRDTRIVALTAHLLREEEKQLLATDFDQCLTKPITEEQLKQLLESCVASDYGAIHMPVRIELCLSRARNKVAFAKEFLQDLLHSLSSAHAAITRAMQQRDHAALLQETHKLHGACCYSGVPHLQQCSQRLEDLLKRDPTSIGIGTAVTELLDAIQELQRWSDNHDLDVLFEHTTAAHLSEVDTATEKIISRF